MRWTDVQGCGLLPETNVIENACPDWTAMEKIEERLLAGESREAAIAYAQAHHAVRSFISGFVSHLSAAGKGQLAYVYPLHEAYLDDALRLQQEWRDAKLVTAYVAAYPKPKVTGARRLALEIVDALGARLRGET